MVREARTVTKRKKYAPRLTENTNIVKEVSGGLQLLKSKIESLMEANKDIKLDNILKGCNFSSRELETFKIFISCDFDYEKILLKTYIAKENLANPTKNNFYIKLNNFSREKALKIKEEVYIPNYARITKEIKIRTLAVSNDEDKAFRIFPKGTKVEFEYDVEKAKLFVFKFFNEVGKYYSFPLYEHEFEWI